MKAHRFTIALALLSLVGSLTHARPNLDPDHAQKQAMNIAFNISDAFEYAAEKIEPSVVHITVHNIIRNRKAGEGLGSGVIVDPRGYILTNNHVIETGNTIIVRLADGRELDAKLIGTFAETDLAVIKIDADGLIAAPFGDSEAMRVGQWVLAIGSPFGFEQTVTAGIVSAKGRGSFSPKSSGNQPTTKLQEYIQTDAAINPGNSGGPLVDLHGNIVGINTAIISRTGSNNGLGFAIPADIAQAVMEQIIDTGTVQRGWLGVSMQILPPTRAHQLDIDGGVLIKAIVPDGPAQNAGLEAQDIIVSLGGRSTENIIRLSNAIMLSKPNEPVAIEFIRDDQRKETTAVVSNRDIEINLALRRSAPGFYLEDIGAKFAPGSMTLPSRRRGTPPKSLPGYIVTSIDADSPADLRGLSIDDFIYSIDGLQFESPSKIEQYLSKIPEDQSVHITFYRNRRNMYIDLIPN